MQLVDAGDAVRPKGENDVTRVNSSLFRGAALIDLVHHDGCVDRKLVFIDQAPGQGNILASDANPAASYTAVLQELRNDELKQLLGVHVPLRSKMP